jgi:outer membrane protein OmpA-like peptidoglycan-associated protein
MSTSNKNTYRCHHCKEEAKISTPACKNCGSLGIGHFELDPLTTKVSLVCEGCGELQNTQDRPPIECFLCHQGTFDWWNADENTWFKLNLTPQTTSSSDVWIQGDFDGDFESVLKPEFRNIVVNPGTANYFDILFKHSYLRNIQRITAPPLSLGPQEIRPFTSPLIYPVDVQTPQVSSEEPHVNRVALRDFRLHQWEFVGSVKSPAHEETKRFGRIQGTGYGILQEHDPKEDVLEEEPKNIVEQAVTQVREFSQGPQKETVVDDQVITEPEHPYDTCFSCSTFLHIILFILVWIACTLKIAGLFILFISIVCWLDESLGKNDLQIKSKLWGIVFGLLLLLVSGAALTIGYWPEFIQECHELSKQALIVTAVAFLLSALLRSCFVKTLLLFFLFIALCAWCKIHDRDCRFTPTTNSFEIVANYIQQQIAILTDHDVNSEMINDASQNNPNGQRISLDQANQKPELLDNCKNRIYIPFAFNSSDIDPNTNIKLYRLGMILKQYNPEKIIISGYTSKDVGDETPTGYVNNINLSVERTNAIKTYLVENDFIGAEKIETRGFGYSLPILPNDVSNSINRRVEVNIQCTDYKIQ